MILLLVLACNRDKTTEPIDTDQPIHWDTSVVTDDSGTPDSGETGETGEPEAVPTGLVASPDGLVVHPGASWRVRAVGSWSDGTSDDVDATWTSSDESVLSVADGVATATAAGSVTLTATWGEHGDALTVEVRDDGLLTATVVDADTGAVIPGVVLVIDEGDELPDDDGDGVVSTAVSSGAGLAVTASADGYVPATIWATVSRELILPLRPTPADEEIVTSVSGDVDVSAVPEAEFGEIIVGLAASSLQGHPLLVEPDALLSDNRSVSLYGIDAELPQNVYIDDVVETYIVPVQPGEAAVWSLAGALPVGDVTLSLDGAADALDLLWANVDGLMWDGDAVGALAEGGEAELGLAPDLPLDVELTAALGELPLGFSGDERALVLTGTMGEAGLLVTGFGVGSADMTVRDAGISADLTAVAVAQVGGLGSGDAMCATTAAAQGDHIPLPPLPEAPDLGEFDPATRTFALSTDERMRFVRVTITGKDHGQRDLYLDGGAMSGILPYAYIPFWFGSTDWELLSLEPETEAFEAFVSTGRLDELTAAEGARSASRVTREY